MKPTSLSIIRKKPALVALAIISALTLASCKEKDATGSGGAAPVPGSGGAAPATGSGAPSESSKYPRTVTRELTPDGNESEGSGNAVLPEIAEKEFARVDWTKPELKPSLSLELASTEWLRVKLTEASTAERPEFVALWRKQGEPVEVEGKIISVYSTYSSPPMSEQAKVLDLLKTYADRDKAYETAVGWTEVE